MNIEKATSIKQFFIMRKPDVLGKNTGKSNGPELPIFTVKKITHTRLKELMQQGRELQEEIRAATEPLRQISGENLNFTLD